MRYLFLAHSDWSNVGYGFAESMKAIGEDAIALVAKKHIFGYEKQAKQLESWIHAQNEINEADVVVLLHSQYIMADYADKPVFVFHGGSAYRQSYKEVNRVFNPLVKAAFIQTYDLPRRGAKNPHTLFPAMDTDALQPDYEGHGRRFAHYPSNYLVKKSSVISDVVDKIATINADINIGGKPHTVMLEDMAKCDIYVEHFADYAHWGVSALEAGALGKVVVGKWDDQYRKKYESEFGKCPIISTNTVEQLESELRRLMEMDDKELKKIKRATRKWVDKWHSLEATGNRIKEIVESYV